MNEDQHTKNVRAGSEPLDGTGEQKSTLVQSGMGYNGELQLAGRITLRGTGANTIEVRLTGNAKEKVVDPAQLAGLIEDHFFTD